MDATDRAFYQSQNAIMMKRYAKTFARLGWTGAGSFFEDMRIGLYNSPVFIWSFLVGFENDIKQAMQAPKGTNRRVLLNKLAYYRVGRITKEYRKVESYLASI